MTLEGKVAVVTGGARGLGREYAERFAADGVAVVITDVLADELARAAEEIGTGDRRVLPVIADVTEPTATASIAAAAVDAFGRIDVLVNNAGIWGDFQRTPLLDIDPDYWDFVMAVNVRGPLLCAARGRPDHDRPGRRGDRQHLVDGRLHGVRRVRGVEAGAQPAHVRARHRARAVRHHGERRRPGADRQRGEPASGAAGGRWRRCWTGTLVKRLGTPTTSTG